MPNGRVDIRSIKRSGKARLRFYNLASDQLENILTALEQAREELGTEYDSVALDALATHYLATPGNDRPQGKRPTLDSSAMQKESSI